MIVVYVSEQCRYGNRRVGSCVIPTYMAHNYSTVSAFIIFHKLSTILSDASMLG